MINIIRRLLKKKYIIFIIIVTLLFGIGGQMYNILIAERQKSMVIEFNYPGAEKGLNPDGSMFEISDLKSPEVISKAKEKLKNNDIDTEFLRSRVFITSKISETTLDKIVSAVQDEKNSIYMPTTFYVYYSQKNKFSKNESIDFMENLAEAYTEHFKEKYSEKNDILLFNPEKYNFKDMDYLEIYTILKNKVDSMYTYITNHRNENRAFYSEDKVNLGMAAKKIESFRDINLEKFYSYVAQNAISKNNREFSKRTDYLISDNTLDYNKLYDASEISRKALEKYEPGIAAVAFVPSVDAKRNYYMSRTKTGLDDLTKQSYSNGMTASKVLKDIEYYKSLYDKFSTVSTTDESKKETAEKMIANLSDDLVSLSSEVIKTDNEYLEHKTMNYFKVCLPENHTLNISLIIKFMILGFILAFAIVFFIEFLKKAITQKISVMTKSFSNMDFVKSKRGE